MHDLTTWSAFTRVHSPSKTGVNALQDALRSMIPNKLAPHVMRGVKQLSEKIMLRQQSFLPGAVPCLLKRERAITSTRSWSW
jgi:hypothetical protein